MNLQIPPPLTFSELLLGEMPLSEWLFCVFLMLLGALLYVLLRIQNRKDKTRKRSFKVWFSSEKNIVALPITLILTYVLIRFYSNYQQAFLAFLPDGFEMTQYFTMLVVGFAQHRISEWIGKQAKTS